MDTTPASPALPRADFDTFLRDTANPYRLARGLPEVCGDEADKAYAILNGFYEEWHKPTKLVPAARRTGMTMAQEIKMQELRASAAQ